MTKDESILRLDAIQARLNGLTQTIVSRRPRARQEFDFHAPADIAYLIGEVRRMNDIFDRLAAGHRVGG